MNLKPALEDFFSTQAPMGPEDAIVVGYSGGSDSLALALGLQQLSSLGLGRPHLCHVDHGLDPDSHRRAEEARRIAEQIGLPITVLECAVGENERRQHGLEAAARKTRYAALSEELARLDGKWIATAHHRDDQVETVLLRLLFGSGLAGMAGIPPRRGAVVRPFLKLQRHDLQAFVDSFGIQPVQDPTNLDLRAQRNRVRHLLLPLLEQSDSAISRHLENLGAYCDRLSHLAESRVSGLVKTQKLGSDWAIRRGDLETLPDQIKPLALSLLHKRTEIPYPPRKSAITDLIRQLEAGKRIGCDCGDDWRWESSGAFVKLCQIPPQVPSFAYTLTVPGECELQELSLRFRIRRGKVADWMYRHASNRTALDLSISEGDTVVVRNRRPGDRLKPLGCSYTRRLKDVLIDKKVPRVERSRLPLLVVQGRLAWVPGVTIEDLFRLTNGSEAWIAELEEM